MKNINLVFVCLCLLFTSSYGDGAKQEKDNNNSEEIIGEQDARQTKCHENDEKDCDIDYGNSNETGPLDSHEAMNTREFKARNKRSTGVDKKASLRNMILGRAPHKKSQDMADEIDAEPQKFQGDASELLLELLVRIATHPQQWNEVHTLLQKIDSDIVTSKKIITDLEKPEESTTGSDTITTGMEQIENITHRTSSTADDVQNLIILLGNQKANNNLSTNSWPNLEPSTNSSEEFEEETYQNEERFAKDQTAATTRNIWPNKPAAKNTTTREFEFAYHRVTGQPLPYRSNYDKPRARNAYIAVSVIGPKSSPLEKQDRLLEDELQQLKPWNKNLPARRWIFQSHLHKNSNVQAP